MATLKATQQELFEVKDVGPRKKIIRQDRVLVEPKTCTVTIDKSDFEVLNLSSFGIALLVPAENIDQIKKLIGESLSDIAISFKQYTFQEISLRPVRVEKHQISNDWVVGCEVLSNPIDIDQLDALEKSRTVVIDQQEYQTSVQSIPTEFRLAIYQLKDILDNLRKKVNNLETETPTDSQSAFEAYRSTIVLSIADYLGKLLPSFYKSIPQVIEKYDKATKDLCVKFARSHLGPFVYGAPFAKRAYSKPRGYAGDYEMMNQIYRDDLAGETLFDQCMHKYFVDEPAGQAVKNREKYLNRKITQVINESKKDVIRILSVASGPALEVQTFLTQRNFPKDKKVEFHFIDQDEEALKHAQLQILSLERFVKSGYKFSFHNLAIKNILVSGIPLAGYDLIYSAGLFDYFTDPVAIAAGKAFVDALTSQGTAIIGNFSKKNPNVPFMELVLDWHLIYRDEKDLERLFSKYETTFAIEDEPLGINLFCVLKK